MIVATIGFSSGKMIRKKIEYRLQPSINAASSSSFGTFPINPVSKKIVSGKANVTCSRMIDQYWFNPPISTTNLYKGTKMVKLGTTRHEMHKE
ncbi:hypothetical protein D3C74_411560 [compost metagenome]